jgi:hypothetical protein
MTDGGRFLTAAIAGIGRTVAHADEGLERAVAHLAEWSTVDLDAMPPGFIAVAALTLTAEAGRIPPTQYLALPLEVLETADTLTGEATGPSLVDAFLAAHALPGPLGPRCERFGRIRNLAIACLLPAGHPLECPAGAIIDRAAEVDPWGVTLELEDGGEFEELVGALSREGFEQLPDGWTAEDLYAHHGVETLLPWARRIAGHQVRS